MNTFLLCICCFWSTLALLLCPEKIFALSAQNSDTIKMQKLEDVKSLSLQKKMKQRNLLKEKMLKPEMQQSSFSTTDKNFNSDELSFFDDYEMLAKSTEIRSVKHTPNKLHYTEEIIVKQGRLKGIVRHFENSTGLRNVDQYFGLPYAEPPVGSRRFMPPRAPVPWQGLKMAYHLPAVCPQKLPNISVENSAQMATGRYARLNRLLPYLKNESEDCLYLNVFVPQKNFGPTNFPVLVYIHGESFEWNSGNAYDGSVIASYGQVIVVTFNYRLGILGFMNLGTSEKTIANFGLLDQIAALHWVKENIESFGGDKTRVTLMGHTTGAACINYLMGSPVSVGLFHRVILMSGSATSPLANTKQSSTVAREIASKLNCFGNNNEEILACLRDRDYKEILQIQKSFTKLFTPFTPAIDGYVIPNDPATAMGFDNFRRYDLLFGVTESEAYHIFDTLAIAEGFREDERDSILRSYLQNRFQIRPDLAVAATLNKYNDIYTNPLRGTNLEHRELILDMLSDSNVVGPLVQTALYNAEGNQQNFMYVFGHNSVFGAHSQIPYSVAGEELAFVFGAPLAPVGPFHHSYTAQEKLLAEAVITYWTNFAKTGNPKTPWKDFFINLHALEWDHYDIDWPKYNKRTQAYLNIGIPPSVGYKYRQMYTNFWNKELPNELQQIALLQQEQRVPAFSDKLEHTNGEIISGHINKYATRERQGEDSLRRLTHLLKQASQPTTSQENTVELNEQFLQPTEIGQDMDVPQIFHIDQIKKEETEVFKNKQPLAPPNIAKSETTLYLLIALIFVFMIINLVIYSTILNKRRRNKLSMTREIGAMFTLEGAPNDDFQRSKPCTQIDNEDVYINDTKGESNAYEILHRSYDKSRLSTSTVDIHTKVSEWISNANLMVSKNLKKTQDSGFSSIFGHDNFQNQISAFSDDNDLNVMKLNEEPTRIICEEVKLTDENLYGLENCLQLINNDDYQKTTSFIENENEIEKAGSDINVTSRDENTVTTALSPEQQLFIFKSRNYPKVLPTTETNNSKRNSLPADSFSQHIFDKHYPPVPPPRTVSTLNRRFNNNCHSQYITTSPLKLAEDCTEEEEIPEITENTLIVGPLIPRTKSGHSIKKEEKEPPEITVCKECLEEEKEKEEETIVKNTEQYLNSFTATESDNKDKTNKSELPESTNETRIMSISSMSSTLSSSSSSINTVVTEFKKKCS